MYAIFTDLTARKEGVVLALGDDRLRLAVRGAQDAVELRYTDGQWTIDGGKPVQMEFVATEAAWGAFQPMALYATAGVREQVA